MQRNNVLILVTLLSVTAFAEEAIQPLRLIDCHTAGILPRATWAAEGRIYPSGDVVSTSGSGTLLGVSVGLTNRLNIGLSYGGDGIVGRNVPVFNPHIGGFIKFRIVEESFIVPAFALGYDHQGFGGIDDSYNGYVFKSQGFFLAASKNYLLFTVVQLGVHAGLNYSLEEYENIKWPNGWVGFDVGIGRMLSIAAEYDLALNARDKETEPDTVYYNPSKGYLNIGARWSFSPDLYIELAFKDLLQSKINGNNQLYGWGRELKLVYILHF